MSGSAIAQERQFDLIPKCVRNYREIYKTEMNLLRRAGRDSLREQLVCLRDQLLGPISLPSLRVSRLIQPRRTSTSIEFAGRYLFGVHRQYGPKQDGWYTSGDPGGSPEYDVLIPRVIASSLARLVPSNWQVLTGRLRVSLVEPIDKVMDRSFSEQLKATSRRRSFYGRLENNEQSAVDRHLPTATYGAFVPRKVLLCHTEQPMCKGQVR